MYMYIDVLTYDAISVTSEGKLFVLNHLMHNFLDFLDLNHESTCHWIYFVYSYFRFAVL